MDQKTILVTGGAGYIGSACAHALVEEGYKVVVIDNLTTGQKDKVHPKATFVDGDVTDAECLAQIFAAHQFGAVVHLAAKKSVAESEEHPTEYFHTNVTGTLNVLAAMEEHHVPHSIFSSTATVYAPQKQSSLFSESSLLGPVNIYAQTKLIAEDCIRAYQRTGKITHATIFRYFNVAGDVGLQFAEKNPQNIFPVLHARLHDQQPFKIFGTDYNTKDGTCIRDYVHLADIVDAHVRTLQKQISGTFNLGTSNGYSVREVLQMFRTVSGLPIDAIETDRRPGDSAVILADSKYAQEILGWHPEYALEDMVRSTL